LGSPPAKCGQLSATKLEDEPQALSVRPTAHVNNTAIHRFTVIIAIESG